MKDLEADICIIAEGSYPYYSGGVAEWVQQLIHEHTERTFHILTLMPPHPNLTMRYKFPENVVGHSVYIIQDLPSGAFSYKTPKDFWDTVGPVLKGMSSTKDFEGFGPALETFRKYEKILGKKILCESHKSWNFILDWYNQKIPSGPFKAYFGTAYTMSRSFFSIILPPLPKAKIYHSVCTGYAGFLLYRAKQEKNAPCILTEHGVYSNERRIEIAMADWIADLSSLNLALEDRKDTLKDFWLNAFFSMAHACYISSDEVLCTFDGNQELQIEGGADPKKVRTVVHGVKRQKFAKKGRNIDDHVPTVAFIGRIVPIKDVKSYIRACKIVHEKLPGIKLLAIGPTEEDTEYYEACQELVAELGLTGHFEFTGRLKLDDFFPKLDLLVLTSLSEAQPLVMLEAGAAAIPCVATNVGACDQLINGSKNESPPIGPAGIVTPLVNPEATAEAILKIITHPEFYKQCSENMLKRISTYYVFEEQHEEYRRLYTKYINQVDQSRVRV